MRLLMLKLTCWCLLPSSVPVSIRQSSLPATRSSFRSHREELIYGDVSAELFASVLRCRISAMLCRQNSIDGIKSVEVRCLSELEEDVTRGLQIKGPLCENCTAPRLVKLNVDGYVG